MKAPASDRFAARGVVKTQVVRAELRMAAPDANGERISGGIERDLGGPWDPPRESDRT
jgi:hypothetical protein